jgi:hypothetical protein
MKIYTIHPPRSRADAATMLDAVTLAPEGFSWAAFFFGPVWLATKHMWLAAAIWLAVALAAALFAASGAATGGSAIVVALLLELFFGLEAHDLHRRALERVGRGAIDVVCARDGTEALARFLFRRLAGPEAVVAAPVAPTLRSWSDARFLGLFDDGRGS